MITRYRFVAPIALLLAVVVVGGCSKKDKGTGNTLTTEEQFGVLTTIVDTTNVGASVMPLALNSVGTAFWDGVDPGDYDLGSLLPSLFPGPSAPRPEPQSPGALAKQIPSGVAATYWLPALSAGVGRALADADSLIITYDVARGWWIATLDAAIDLDTIGMGGMITVSLRDSLRFDNSQTNIPTPAPIQTTNRFQRGTYLNAQVSDLTMGGEEGSIDAGLLLRSSTVVTDLDQAIATVNGNSMLSLSVDATIPTTDENDQPIMIVARGSMGIANEVHDLDVPVEDVQTSFCPSTGGFDMTITMDLYLEGGGVTGTAQATWDLSVVFTGNGMGQVSISSVGFDWSQSGPICQP